MGSQTGTRDGIRSGVYEGVVPEGSRLWGEEHAHLHSGLALVWHMLMRSEMNVWSIVEPLWTLSRSVLITGGNGARMYSEVILDRIPTPNTLVQRSQPSRERLRRTTVPKYEPASHESECVERLGRWKALCAALGLYCCHLHLGPTPAKKVVHAAATGKSHQK